MRDTVRAAMSEHASILGVGMTPLGGTGGAAETLATAAARAALADAGMDVEDVRFVVLANALGGLANEQEMVRGQVWLRALGLGTTPILNVEAACAGGAAALSAGDIAVRAGDGPVLVVAVERMRVGAAPARQAAIWQSVAPPDRPARSALGYAGAGLMAETNSGWAEDLLRDKRATVEQFAAAAVKAHRNASANPLARHREVVTVADVLRSPHIAGPLTRLMCASFTDGAAAVVLDAGNRPGALCRLRSCVMVSGDGSRDAHAGLGETAAALWDTSGVGAADVDLVELHDAASPEEIYTLEAMGFFEAGEAGPATEAGRTAIGGSGPVVNPSGGLVGRGHPIGATGLCQVVEIAQQLAGRSGDRQVDGARLGLAMNWGGIVGADTAVTCLTLLEGA